MIQLRSSDPVAITGIGPIAPEVMNVQELVAAVQTPIRSSAGDAMRPLTGFEPHRLLGKRGIKFLTPATRYALGAAHLAVEDAGLGEETYGPEHRGVVVGTNFAVHEPTETMDRVILSEGAQALSALETPNFSVNIPASFISLWYRYLAFNITLASTLVAGLEAVLLGAHGIQQGRAQMVLAGATEGRSPRRMLGYLGGTIAEGAACILSLERLSRAEARGARSYATVGAGIFGFVPPSSSTDPADLRRLAESFHRLLDQTLRPNQATAHLFICDGDFAIGRVASSCLLRCLHERGIGVVRVPPGGLAAIAACASPVLGLAACAALHGEGLVLAASPHGHVVLLRLDPVGRGAGEQRD